MHLKVYLPLKVTPFYHQGPDFGFLRHKMYRSVVGATIWCPYRHSSKTIEDFLFEQRKVGVSVEILSSALHFKVYFPLKMSTSHQKEPDFGFLRQKMYRSVVGATIWRPYRHSSRAIEDFPFERRKTAVSVEKFGIC